MEQNDSQQEDVIKKLCHKNRKAVIIYNLNSLRLQLSKFRNAFMKTGRKIETAYSYKTNPILAPFLHEIGCKMEVTCENHLVEALKFCKGIEIVLTTPDLGTRLLKKCFSEKVHIIADSVEQLYQIDELANGKVKAGLRNDNRGSAPMTL